MTDPSEIDVRQRMEQIVRGAQDAISGRAAAIDGGVFREDAWERAGGGGGSSRVLQDGAVFEKAGVNVSAVHGVLPPTAIASMVGGRLDPADYPTEADRRFFATGVSVVIHPHNPMAPTAHCNYRYFELGKGTWWFGGGADLTPAYLFEEDVRHFHAAHKDACDRHDPAFYPRFKAACDDYFHIPHRGERRGVGGIFFDDLHDRAAEELAAFVADCAAAFVDAYFPLVERHRGDPFTEAQKRWQALRRGRYVEFNLVYDRGTTFGLQTGGRVESILMSLPLSARWEYDHVPAAGSDEARLVEVLRQPRNWV